MVLQIVLAGGGLCNIQVAKLVHDYLSSVYPSEVSLTLISACEFTYYSAMYPGLVAQQYQEESIRIELRPLALACNARLVIGRIAQIKRADKVVVLEDSSAIEYDILSVNLGCQTRGAVTVPGLSEFAILTRPLSTFLRTLEAFEARILRTNEVPKVVVAGAGLSGIELALVLKARFAHKYSNAPVSITLVDNHTQVVASATDSLREVIVTNLQKIGVKLLANSTVKEIRENEVELADGRILMANLAVWATGPEPVNVLHDLETCNEGFILVKRTLQSTHDPRVFAGGDCVTIHGLPSGFPPKTGANALREGPVIGFNIVAMAKHLIRNMPISLMIFEPQVDELMLVNLGDGRGVATKYGMTFSGKWVFQLKSYMNKRLIAKFSPARLLGPRGYILYQQFSAPCDNANRIYSELDPVQDDYSHICWHDNSPKALDLDNEVNKLDAELALNLVLESSDTLKEGSCLDFEFQFAILKRTDRDMVFRNALRKAYQGASRESTKRRSNRSV